MAEGEWAEYTEPVSYVRHKGVWDMQDLYESIADWFRKRKYKFHERVYKHKHPSPYGVERQYIWEAERKESAYIEFKYNVYIHTYDAHDIEVVMADGNKKIFTKGRLWVEIKADIVSGWEERWKEKSFYSKIRDFYNKYVIKKEFTHGWGPKIRYEMYELQAMVKERLKMESDEYEHRHFSGVHRRF